MVRTLLLVRHAKAVPEAASDAARALAPRGRRDARAAGQWLVEHGHVPDLAVVSPALRAKQTWETAAARLGTISSSRDARIYDNTVESLLAVVQETAADATTFAMVGHNPSMHALAAALDDGSGDALARADLAGGFPTMGIAVLQLSTDWPDLTPGSATLMAFAAPRG